jgi:hypothetical protein
MFVMDQILTYASALSLLVLDGRAEQMSEEEIRAYVLNEVSRRGNSKELREDFADKFGSGTMPWLEPSAINSIVVRINKWVEELASTRTVPSAARVFEALLLMAWVVGGYMRRPITSGAWEKFLSSDDPWAQGIVQIVRELGARPGRARAWTSDVVGFATFQKRHGRYPLWEEQASRVLNAAYG